ncbi:Zinc finger protein 26 [Frankliniella fusca]|uniref:Zinc finger protein 26 n=1 Tax=Frankliniella fusca TaxID=407009 RepID=A0AAE1LBZ8_9NEOP|nr:Zinc finger protein 26 [Frankliniella fusca]
MCSKRSFLSGLQDRNKRHVEKVFGDKLTLEEKLQVLEALLSTSEKKSCLDSFKLIEPEPSLDNKISFDCAVCGKTYQTSSQYHGHLKKHKEDNFQWACPQCPEGTSSFKSLSLLRKHLKLNHEGTKTVESQPKHDEFLKSPVKVTNQFKEPTDTAQFSCQLCVKYFTKKSDLRGHIATHLSLKGFVCEVCGRPFSHMSNLIRHSYVHSGFKPYPCKLCGKRFTQVASLNQHSISYHSNKLFPCPAVPEKCDKMFRTPIIAKQHAYRVHPEVQWENLICKNSNSKRERKYYCRLCGETFVTKNKLNFHFKQHNQNITCTKESKETSPKLETGNLLEIKVTGGADSSINVLLESYDDCSNDNYDSDQKKASLEHNRVNTEMRNGSAFRAVDTSDPHIYDDSEYFGICVTNVNQADSIILKPSNNSSSFETQINKIEIKEAGSIGERAINIDLASTKNYGKAIKGNSLCSGEIEQSSKLKENVQSNLTRGKDCEMSCEIELGQDVNEETSLSMSHDVDMGLCPDSPSNTLHNQPIFENDNDVHDQFGVKSLESYQIPEPEPLILSFGDSYSALLKEIGIADETNLEESSKATNTSKEQEDCQNGLQNQFLSNNYSMLLKDLQDVNKEETQSQNSHRNQLKEMHIGAASTLVGNTSTENVKENCQLLESLKAAMEVSENKDMVIYFVQNSSTNEVSSVQGESEMYIKQFQEKASPNVNLLCRDDCYKESVNLPIKVTKPSQKKHCKIMSEDTVNHPQKNGALETQCHEGSTRLSSSPLDEFLEFPKSSKEKSGKKCPECGKIFFKASNFTQHLGLHFPNMKAYKCRVCNLSFSWKSSLNKHMNSHLECPAQFLCDICGKKYKSFNQVQQHKKRDHECLRPNACTLCNKSFFRKHDLLIHQRIHANNKPFMCKICGKVFNHISHIKRHENIHLKDGTRTVVLVSLKNLQIFHLTL